jgi:hypothetical protein
MRRSATFALLLLLILFITSCDDEIFGPRTWEGFWDVTEESSAFGELKFTVWIEEYPGDDSKLIIYDFSFLEGADVVADISDRTLTIQQQSVVARGGTFRISGTGTASANRRRIDWQYRVDGNNYTAIYIKK